MRLLVAIPVYMGDDFSGVVVCANREGGFADCEDSEDSLHHWLERMQAQRLLPR